jgi:hypothetical protein
MIKHTKIINDNNNLSREGVLFFDKQERTGGTIYIFFNFQIKSKLNYHACVKTCIRLDHTVLVRLHCWRSSSRYHIKL